jgi:diacylglycerol kinase family enzyme
MYYFIVNPQAQSGRGAVVWKRIRRVMEKKGLPFKALFTEYAGHATELACYAAEQNEEKKIILLLKYFQMYLHNLYMKIIGKMKYIVK